MRNDHGTLDIHYIQWQDPDNSGKSKICRLGLEAFQANNVKWHRKMPQSVVSIGIELYESTHVLRIKVDLCNASKPDGQIVECSTTA